jgi:hypothetical protein
MKICFNKTIGHYSYSNKIYYLIWIIAYYVPIYISYICYFKAVCGGFMFIFALFLNVLMLPSILLFIHANTKKESIYSDIDAIYLYIDDANTYRDLNHFFIGSGFLFNLIGHLFFVFMFMYVFNNILVILLLFYYCYRILYHILELKIYDDVIENNKIRKSAIDHICINSSCPSSNMTIYTKKGSERIISPFEGEYKTMIKVLDLSVKIVEE